MWHLSMGLIRLKMLMWHLSMVFDKIDDGDVAFVHGF
jgi:hypothetical protein